MDRQTDDEATATTTTHFKSLYLSLIEQQPLLPLRATWIHDTTMAQS